VKSRPYRDTEGLLTVGVGHLLDATMPDALIELILDFDISVAIEELDRAFDGWRDHSPERQNVLIELQFNLGANRLAGFVKFWAAMKARDYARASQELLASKWAAQVGKRSTTLARRLQENTLA
jgi:lysozyme